MEPMTIGQERAMAERVGRACATNASRAERRLVCCSSANRTDSLIYQNLNPRPPNETVEKHAFSHSSYTQTQDFNALLSDDPVCHLEHCLIQSSTVPGFQLTSP